jgi:hypothetical protein
LKGGSIRVNLLIAWKWPKEPLKKGLEPWYVVTILESPQQALACYRRRMRIAEGFRDWKQRLGLGQAAVSSVERVACLVTGLVLATLVLALLRLFGLPAGFSPGRVGAREGQLAVVGLVAIGASQAAGAWTGVTVGGKFRFEREDLLS